MSTLLPVKNGILFVFVYLVNFGRFLECCNNQGTTKILQMNITGDHSLDLYVDGRHVISNIYPAVAKININIGANVVAVRCRDGGSDGWIGGILASLSNGIVTDKEWTCTTRYEPGWNMANFDEYGWEEATEHQTNSHSLPVAPYGKKLDISENAKFIWTTNQFTQKDVYCRRSLVNRCNEGKQRFYTSREEYINKAYTDSIFKITTVASVMECAMRCLNTPKCASFNYEITEKDMRKCELNQSKALSSVSLATSPGFQYFELIKVGY